MSDRASGEHSVRATGGEHSVRSQLLSGNRRALGQPLRAGERLAQAFAAPLAPLIPRRWRPIAAATVARALHRALLQAEPGLRILDSAMLATMGNTR